ncbi:MAG: SDR family NAD(P)-dependent oxidoreductase, partial [Beijerinckiaceae bacterium]|nr:SDR family NAD(P)-dependent oxidoreductase [Beijerinckiaceae bacterium]
MDIKGLTAIVTGGASGLGEATARVLAAQGARVAIVDMNGERAASVAKDIGGKSYVLDVSNAAAAEAFFAQLEADLGAPRVLVNCAGIGVAGRMVGRNGPVPLEEFSKVINVNLIGSFNMMRLAAAAMIKTELIGE